MKFLSPLDEGEQPENKSKHDKETFRSTSFMTVGNLGNSRIDNRRDDNSERESLRTSLVFELLNNVYKQMRSLGSPPLFKWAILCWTIYFTNMFG